MTVYMLTEWLLGLLVFGSIGLLTFFTVLILYIFLREFLQERLW